MNYDKNSFVAGVKAGQQMKGWAIDEGGRTIKPWIESDPAIWDEPPHGSLTWNSSTVDVEPAPGETTVPPNVYLQEYVKVLCALSGWTVEGDGRHAPYGDGNYGTLLRTNTTDTTVEIFNSGTTLNLYVYHEQVSVAVDYATYSSFLTYNVRYIANAAYYSGLDWETFQLLAPAFPGTYGTARGYTLLTITDYYTPETKIVAAGRAGTTYRQPLGNNLNKLYRSCGTGTTPYYLQTQMIRPYEAIWDEDVFIAAPLNLYNTTLKFSGFVGGMNNLYHITRGNSTVNTAGVDNQFTIADSEFVGGGGYYGLAIRVK